MQRGRRRAVAAGALAVVVGVVAVVWQLAGDRASRAGAGGAPTDQVNTGVWVHQARSGHLVPQGLALGPGREAFISGFRWGKGFHRNCQLAVVDRHTGRTLAWLPELTGRNGLGQTVSCKHGGGLAYNSDGLWLFETWRLWLLDPDEVRAGQVTHARIWEFDHAVKGSTGLVKGDRIGVVGWKPKSASHTYWFARADLLADGIIRLGTSSRAGVAGPVDSVRIPRMIQGAAVAPGGGVWYSASTTFCGMLHLPGGRRIAFVPGAEGIAFDGDRLWVVSEAGSRLYQRRGGRPAVPTLSAVALDELDRERPTGCSWDPG